MVSLNTCPQPGFSKKRSTLPSSRVMTMPNSSGFSTAQSAMVASARVLLVELDDRGQVDVGEHVTRDHQEALVSSSRALRTEPAVPSGVSSVA